MLAGKRHVALRQFSSQLKKIPREFEKELLQRQVISTLYKILPAIQRAPTDKQRLQVLWSVCESMLNSFDDQCWKSLPKSLVGDILVGLREIDGFESKKSLLLAKIRASVGGVPELEDKNVAFESVGDFRRWHDLKISPSKGKIELVHAVLVNSCLNASFNAIKAIFTDAQQLYTLNYTLISEMLTKKALIPQLSLSERVKYAQIIQWIADFKVSGRDRVNVLNNLISLRNITSFNACVAIVSEFNLKLVSMNDDTFVIMIRKLNEKEAIKFLEYLNRNNLPWVKASIEFLRLNLSQRAQIAFSFYLAVPDKVKLLSNIIDNDHWMLDSLFMTACTRSSSVVNNFVEDIEKASVTIGSSNLTSGILYLCRSGRVDTASNVFTKLRDFSQDDQNIHKDVFAVTEAFVNERKISFAFKFVKFVQGHNYPIGRRVHMQLLNGLISQGQLEKALNWFSENCKTSDIKLFNTLLQGFVDFDLDKKVEMLLGKMDEWKISKNDHTFAILIGWYLKNNNTIAAWNLLNNSSAEDLSFAKFIEYYISIGDWSKVTELWNSLPKAGIFDTTTSLVIKASVLSGNQIEIEKIAKGINPCLQPKTSRTLILYYLRIGMVKEAEILLQGMSAVKGVPEKAYAITEFILHYSK